MKLGMSSIGHNFLFCLKKSTNWIASFLCNTNLDGFSWFDEHLNFSPNQVGFEVFDAFAKLQGILIKTAFFRY
jgi:hypothetical protein